ncbi:sensor domain-containing diguanylate cyclase [Dongia deserti]|uniref:sensor domain-containing diguanylate cyclase n=1 Tax=Dongia deserti TaxID=2268030 RepID=UPI0013C3EBAA|nr:diguanylate cyclase [Dongia deserti]
MARSLSSPPTNPADAAGGDMDVTLRAALIESRQRMKELLELSCDFAWETDSNGLFSFVTAGGALGHETLDLLGSDPADLVLSPEDGRHFQADSPPEGLLVWASTKAGMPRCLHLKARAIFDQHGEFQCVRGACRDVTAEQDRDAALAAARHRERSLIQLFRALRQAADSKAAMEMGVATAVQATGAAGATLCTVLNGEPSEVVAHFGTPVAASQLARQAIENRQPHRSVVAGRRVLALPGELGGRVAGVLVLWRPEDQPDWPEDDLFLLRELTDQLAVAIVQADEQAALSRLSQTDALTGLLNRRGFEARLKDAVAAACATGSGGALIYVDLDNFKQINDRHGHAQGDAALRAAAELLRRLFRASDLVARLGGDELGAWMDGVDGAEALRRGQELVTAAAALQRFAPESEKKIGFSVGIALLRPGQPMSDGDLIALADRAMYQVKHGVKGGVALLDE